MAELCFVSSFIAIKFAATSVSLRSRHCISERYRDRANSPSRPQAPRYIRHPSRFIVSAAAQEDILIRTLSKDGAISVRVLFATELVRHSASLHGTSPTATAALGRAMMGAVLLANGKKDGETTQIDFRGGGPLGPVVALATTDGAVRGFVSNPSADLPPVKTEQGLKLNVGGLVGREGSLTVTRAHKSYRQPYRGIVKIKTGEVADDLLLYLVESEQVPSALGLGVFVGGLKDSQTPGQVDVAGGFLVQVLPDATEETLTRLEQNVSVLPPTTELLRSGLTPDELIDVLLSGLGSQERIAVRPKFECTCDAERVKSAVAVLGKSELEDIVKDGEDLSVCCEFCRKKYSLSTNEISCILTDWE
eukprot:CAMPEP_0184648518 /NCGR_PEP_ID=MMETSP0308-20130426/5658_1 /TAXON_ID=38269 /ORGANISM="Gloeochaete witrockiana, Strain SAG 46.84" /LENGTH=362 /DNA_ID=CAMNT_0027080403 /DNA_START=42 /DNA_END=1130 /DNA_ORIENTATION=-